MRTTCETCLGYKDMLWIIACAWAGQEIREEKDGAGRLTATLTLSDGTVVSETRYTYDGSNLVSAVTTAGTVRTVERWVYEGSKLVTHDIEVDGVKTSSESFSYEGSRLVSKATADSQGVVELASYRYDSAGRLVEVIAKDAAGNVRSRTETDWDPPDIPIVFSLSGNTSLATLSETVGAGGALSVARKPSPDQYSIDPLEFALSTSYAYARAQGVTTTDDLRSAASVDLNELWNRTTLFAFTTLARNPVASLNVDVYVAPIGIKYVIARGSVWTLDASFAPVWNYRSIQAVAGSLCGDSTLDADGECSTSRLRGSLRVRGGYEDERLSIKDRVEFLPDLAPQGFVDNLDAASIFRNTLTVSLAVSSAVSLSQNLVLTRDRTLASQFDCEGGDDNPACEGWSVENVAALTVSFSAGR